MSKVDFTGLGVALVTPFNNDESVDYGSLNKLIELCDYNSKNNKPILIIMQLKSSLL